MRKPWLITGIALLALLVLLAVWLLLQPPRITGPRAPADWLLGTNPALDLRYRYDPAVLKPSPYDDRAEFPLRLDAADWSFYGKRIAGAGTFLKKEPAPVLYKFITDVYSGVYEEFYRLGQEGETQDENVELQGQLAIRQKLKLLNKPGSRGWPAFFPDSVTHGHTADLLGDDQEINSVLAIPGVTGPGSGKDQQPEGAAWVYAWGLFQGPDLFLFQTVSSRDLTPAEIALAEQVINNMQFQALRATAAPRAAAPEAPTAAAPSSTAAPSPSTD